MGYGLGLHRDSLSLSLLRDLAVCFVATPCTGQGNCTGRIGGLVGERSGRLAGSAGEDPAAGGSTCEDMAAPGATL